MRPVEPCFLVEWYSPEVLGAALADTAAALDATAASMSADGARVRVSALVAVPADEVVFGVFRAGSADAVTQTCDRAGFPVQRVSAATDIELDSGEAAPP